MENTTNKLVRIYTFIITCYVTFVIIFNNRNLDKNKGYRINSYLNLNLLFYMTFLSCLAYLSSTKSY